MPALACQLSAKVCIGDCGSETFDTSGEPEIESVTIDPTTTAATTGLETDSGSTAPAETNTTEMEQTISHA